jgi:hypothetical protein
MALQNAFLVLEKIYNNKINGLQKAKKELNSDFVGLMLKMG